MDELKPLPDGFDAIEDSLTRSRTIIDALRAEVEALRQVVASQNQLLREKQDSVEALKAELERQTAPLTNEQREGVAKIMRVNNNPNLTKWDAAIRQVRGREKA